MKNRIVLTLIFTIALATQAISQTYLVQVKSLDTKKWGYANQKGELVIPAEHTKCFEFSEEGFAPILDPKTKQYKFVNTKGETLVTDVKNFQLISAMGFDVQGFKEGLVPVKVDKTWGYMNTEGKLAIAAQYEKVSEFNSGHGVAKKGTQYFVVNKKGDEIPVTGVTDVRRFSEGLAPFIDASKKFGFINTEGKIAIPAQFESVGYFTAGLAWARTADKKIGYINTKGEWVIKPTFDVAKEFDATGTLARVRVGDAWGYTNAKGEVTYVKDTDLYGDFANGLSMGKKNEKVGFYNMKGEWVIQPQFEAGREFKNGFASVKASGTWGIINTKGEWVIKPQFDAIKDMELVKGN